MKQADNVNSMYRTVLFDPSLGTGNLGDLVIRRAIDREMDEVFSSQFIVRYSTHTPLVTLGSLMRGNHNDIVATCAQADFKFICGTNILKENLFHLNNGWAVGPFTASLYSPSVLIGAGLSGDNLVKVNRYTKGIYHKALSSEHTHSVRDDRAGEFLETLGFAVVNTGCPTTWKLMREGLPNSDWSSPRNTVVFTLTDYNQDQFWDHRFVHYLLESYKSVFFWPQGAGDLAYLHNLGVDHSRISVIPPRLDLYISFLNHVTTDYVGTRLHGGVIAQEFGARTIILTVDGRARDMSKTAPIFCIERKDSDHLRDLLLAWPIPIEKISYENVLRWKEEFTS